MNRTKTGRLWVALSLTCLAASTVTAATTPVELRVPIFAFVVQRDLLGRVIVFAGADGVLYRAGHDEFGRLTSIGSIQPDVGALRITLEYDSLDRILWARCGIAITSDTNAIATLVSVVQPGPPISDSALVGNAAAP
ncbi:MAG: hypothetical protein JSS86_00140 [Cyanobacteria bacterium SZAS LIN-2]|nr:hypothetical protein [Cyanobacteria bacterium SZAS LIN-2]